MSDSYGYPPQPPGQYGNYGAPGGFPPAQRFQATQAFSQGWSIFTKNLPVMLGLGALIVLLSLVGSSITNLFAYGSLSYSPDNFSASSSTGFDLAGTLKQTLMSLVVQILLSLLTASTLKAGLDAAAGRPVTFGGSWQGWNKLQVLLTALLVNVMMSIGLLLCILPGVAVALFTMFATGLVVAGSDTITGIKRSFVLVKENFGESLLLALMLFGITVLGVCLCLIGLIATLPLAYAVIAAALTQAGAVRQA